MPDVDSRGVRKRRWALGLTQIELAALSGVSRGTVRNIEGGKTTDGAALGKVLSALSGAEGVPVDDACTCSAASTLRAIRALLDGMGGDR
jgi:transcriptional regulator with XRE-family HTH domain